MTTEEKIKKAAKSVFHTKGYAATTTRDIAKEANLNLALINYYFRSKEKLFEIIMLESMMNFMQSLVSVFNDPNTSLKEKTKLISANYINLLSNEPDLPLFILSELRTGGLLKLVSSMGINQMMRNSVFYKQIEEDIQESKIKNEDPMQYIMNLISLSVFPFIATPMLKLMGGMDDQDFNKKMEERKKWIPKWIKNMNEKN